jgi:cation diffusion facilitator family transporter
MSQSLELTPAHDHVFGQDQVRPGERRTLIVIAVTAVMMVVEIAAGLAFGSMALLADGLHMASHAAALSIAAFAYVYARRHANDARYTFGTGKVNALGGFAGAVLLAAFATFMAYESVHRLFAPVAIGFNNAILVAVVGLIVNGACAVILSATPHEHHHDHDHDHDDDHHQGHHDHNLRSAYLHVLADALTSVAAIAALVAGKYLGWNWMDPAMGVVGALLVTQWSVSLLRTTAAVLLDRQAGAAVIERVRSSLESDSVHVADLHVWSIGPGIHAAAITLETDAPLPPDHYKRLLPSDANLVHVTMELHARAARNRL